VLVPTFVDDYFTVPPQADQRPPRNGFDYTAPFPPQPDGGPAMYTPDCGLIDASMGTLPARLIVRPESRRGTHPLEPFAAVGPRADELLWTQSATDVYAPIRELIDRDGQILLIGVGLNRMTALHLAEQRSGRRLFVRWTRNAEGRTIMVETGSCSEGFLNVAPIVEPYARRTKVRDSVWAAYPAGATVAAVAGVLAVDQRLTWCADPDCIRCRDSTSGGPSQPMTLG
jgi:aminoglycoside 3-N-acetyltransferase